MFTEHLYVSGFLATVINQPLPRTLGADVMELMSQMKYNQGCTLLKYNQGHTLGVTKGVRIKLLGLNSKFWMAWMSLLESHA